VGVMGETAIAAFIVWAVGASAAWVIAPKVAAQGWAVGLRHMGACVLALMALGVAVARRSILGRTTRSGTGGQGASPHLPLRCGACASPDGPPRSVWRGRGAAGYPGGTGEPSNRSAGVQLPTWMVRFPDSRMIPADSGDRPSVQGVSGGRG
jgi:hypothetical protein